MPISATNYDGTKNYEVMETKDLSSTYFEKKNDSKYGLKSIQDGWINENGRIHMGAYATYGVTTFSGNAARIKLRPNVLDKGTLLVGVYKNTGAYSLVMIYWVKSGNTVSVPEVTQLGKSQINVRFATVTDYDIIIDIDNVPQYSGVTAWSSVGINDIVSISV